MSGSESRGQTLRRTPSRVSRYACPEPVEGRSTQATTIVRQSPRLRRPGFALTRSTQSTPRGLRDVETGAGGRLDRVTAAAKQLDQLSGVDMGRARLAAVIAALGSSHVGSHRDLALAG